MKHTLLISFLAFICQLTVQSQAVYVDSNTGDDKNPGTKESPVYLKTESNDILLVSSVKNRIID